jgi:energy-coupling factor transporter ATP-binding protein EcfA2
VADPPRFTGPPVAAWRFRPTIGRESHRFEAATFRAAVTDALRSGHGLRRAFEMEILSGPHLAVTWRAFDPGSARWFSRIAVLVYAAHQWERVVANPEDPAVASRSWTARRAQEWPEPLIPAGANSALDSLVAVLRASPSGARLRLLAIPLPAPTPGWWTSPLPEPTRSRTIDARRSADVVRDPGSSPGSTPPTRPLFWRLRATLEMHSGSPASRAAIDLGAALAAASRTPRGNGLVFRPRRPPRWVRPVGSDSMIVALEELAAMWPSPGCDVGVGERLEDDRRQVLALGRTSDGVVTGPPFEPHQGRHLAVLGETGMGKSSLLVALACRTLRESGGVVFDPLGETVRSIRNELGSAERRRCLWVAPDAPGVGLNALEGIGAVDDPVRSERRLNDLVHALRRVRAGRYSDSGYWGPRLEEMVTRALRAAAALPDGTLLEGHTLLATSTRLGRPIPLPASEAVRELADRIRDRPEDADGARRLLHEVVRNPVLARMLCDPRPSVRTRDLVASERIVLISGDAARVGESTARYLLSVLLALVWSELLSRTETSKTFVVLDEAQWFSNDSLAEMLRLGRRKNVHVVLATQAIASLPETVAEAVWTNVSDFVAFRGSPEEAREFARAAPGVPAEALLSLPRGEAALLLGKGESVRWVRTVRLPGSRATELAEPSVPAVPPFQRPAGANDDTEPKPTPETPTFDRVFEELVRIGADGREGEPLVVDVSELRRRFDPEGESVRRVGSLLSKAGALSRVDRSEGGHRWVIDRARLSEMVPRPTATSSAEAASRLPQPS